MSAQIEQYPTEFSSATGAAPIVKTGASRGSLRLYIDNLRVLLISMVIVVHLAVTYGAVGSWYYHDPVTNLPTAIILTILSGIGMASDMGFFFLIAGYFTPGSYDRKGVVCEKLGCQCLYRLPDPSPRACRFCLRFPHGCHVSLAQICHFCAHRAPTLLLVKQSHPQDSFG